MAGVTKDTIAVAVVDDHAVVREGTAAIVDREPDMRVVLAAGDLAALRTFPDGVDVVLLDLHLQDESGFTLLSELLERQAERRPAVVILSAFDYSPYVRRALQLGAAGYLPKSAPAFEVVAAVRRAAAGGMTYLVRPSEGEPTFSAREREVMSAVIEGLSNDEIGGRLGVSSRTVESHLRRLFERTSVSSRAELVARAIREGWIAPTE